MIFLSIDQISCIYRLISNFYPLPLNFYEVSRFVPPSPQGWTPPDRQRINRQTYVSLSVCLLNGVWHVGRNMKHVSHYSTPNQANLYKYWSTMQSTAVNVWCTLPQPGVDPGIFQPSQLIRGDCSLRHWSLGL